MADLQANLQNEWNHLVTVSDNWFTHLKSTGSDEDKHKVEKQISMLSIFEQLVNQARRDTIPDWRDIATTMRNYLYASETEHQELTKRSKVDTVAVGQAQIVLEARKAVMEQVKAMHTMYDTTVYQSAPAETIGLLKGGGSGGGGGPDPDELFWLRAVIPLNNKGKRIIKLTEKLLKGPLNDPKDQRRLANLTSEALIDEWQAGIDNLTCEINGNLANGNPQEVAMGTSLLVYVHQQLQETLFNNLNATLIPQESAIP